MNGIESFLGMGLAGLALVGLVVQGLWYRRRLAQMEDHFRHRCDDLGRELHAVGSGSMGVGRRLLESEKTIHRLTTLLEEMRQNDPARVPYDEASRLVELGAGIDDLMNTCGISRPEAELVTALRRREKEKQSEADARQSRRLSSLA